MEEVTEEEARRIEAAEAAKVRRAVWPTIAPTPCTSPGAYLPYQAAKRAKAKEQQSSNAAKAAAPKPAAAAAAAAAAAPAPAAAAEEVSTVDSGDEVKAPLETGPLLCFVACLRPVGW